MCRSFNASDRDARRERSDSEYDSSSESSSSEVSRASLARKTHNGRPDSRVSASRSSSSSSSGTGDDEIIHFDWREGMLLGKGGRYEIRRKLGDGTFGRVVECRDRSLNCKVAVKIIRDIKRYVDNAKVEARILERVNEIRRLSRDHAGGRGIVRLFDIFLHEQRKFCMSFERLGKTLFEVIQMNNYRGFHISDLREIACELLETLAFIHDRCGLTHTDIKMENVMLVGSEFVMCAAPSRFSVSSSSSAGQEYRRPLLVSRLSKGRHRSIRLIDFGNAVFKEQHHSTVINTRQYRSPEVVLEQGWDQKSDVWSTGCVIGEMWTGELLFPAHANLEHLAMIERVTETRFDMEYMAYSPREVREQYSRRDGTLRWPEGCESRSSFSVVNERIGISKLFSDESSCGAAQLGDLLRKLLRIDPRLRYSAEKALDSPFFDSPPRRCSF